MGNASLFRTLVISLENRIDRRAWIKGHFHKLNYSNWEFFPASRGLPCINRSAAEGGHYISVLKALMHGEEHFPNHFIHLCEDDVELSDSFLRHADTICKMMSANDVDLVFTDTNHSSIKSRGGCPDLPQDGKIALLNGSKFYLGRTTSWIVNPLSIKKIRNDIHSEINHPGGPRLRTDIFIREMIRSGLWKAGVCHPFLSIPRINEPEVSKSDIQTATLGAEERWELFHAIIAKTRYIDATSSISMDLGFLLKDINATQIEQIASDLCNALVECNYIRDGKPRRVGEHKLRKDLAQQLEEDLSGTC